MFTTLEKRSCTSSAIPKFDSDFWLPVMVKTFFSSEIPLFKKLYEQTNVTFVFIVLLVKSEIPQRKL